MTDRLKETLAAAIAEGLLPPQAHEPEDAGRPWPVVLLTALGAWLAALPLLGVVYLLLGELLIRGAGPYMVGMLMLAGAAIVLRAQGVPLFFEQLAVPALLVGGGTLAFGLFRDLPARTGSLSLMVVALGVALAIDRSWLRLLLGAVAAGLATTGLALQNGNHGWPFTHDALWLSLHAALLPWLIIVAAPETGKQLWLPRFQVAFETIGAGWILAVLAALACWSGMTFLVAGNLGDLGKIGAELGRGLSRWQLPGPILTPFFSGTLALAGLLWLAKRWPGLRNWRNAGVAGVLAVLAGLLPALGGTVMVAALAAGTQRWRLAGAACLAILWIIGSFYYNLAWSLTDKAVLLVGMAALLGLLAWTPRRTTVPGAAERPPASSDSWRPQGLLAAGAALTLLVANGAIWQKEAILADGQPVFIALQPVDPRSLMQGDYMALNFAVPFSIEEQIAGFLGSGRPRVVLERDNRGVATPKRLALPDETLAPSELLMELTPKNGRWVMVSDAWFFREGEGKRWEAARFGEFRVTPDGKAQLVGMADRDLKPIRP